MITRIKQLSQTTLIYGIGKISLYFIGFLLVPIYTRIFSPADYGIIELINITMFLLGVLTVAGTDSAQTFYFHQKTIDIDEETHQSQLVAVSLQRIFVFGIFWLFVFFINWNWLSEIAYEGEVPFLVIAAAACGMLINQLQANIINVFRLTYRPWLYVIMTFLSGFFSALFSILFVVIIKLGVLGVFIGSALGSTSAFLGGLWGLRRVFPKGIAWNKFSFSLFIKINRFGLPLVPTALLYYVMNTSDRWFIHHFLNTTELGIFSLAAKVSSILLALVGIFRLGFVPLATEMLHQPPQEHHRFFEITFRYYLGGFACLSILLTSIAPIALQFLTPPEYFRAAQFIGWATIPIVLDGVLFFSVLGTWKAEKTFFNTIAFGIGAAVDLVLNWLLIPHYGILGAILSSGIGALVQVSVGFMISRQYYPIFFNFKTAVFQIAVWFACLFFYWFNMTNIIFHPVIMLLTMWGFVVGIAALTIKNEEVHFISAKLRLMPLSLL